MIPAPQSTNSDSAWGFHRGSGWAERTKNGAGRADTAGRARSNEGDIDATITLVNLVLCRHRCVPQGAAAAQIYEPVTARQLLQNPTRYLGYRIELTNAYCASIESGKYECTTSEPLVVRTGNVATPDSRKIMEEECGGLDTTELTPTCRFNLRFVPTTITSEQGSYKRGTKQVSAQLVVIRTESVMAGR